MASNALEPSLPMPTMPRPPAAVTAAASRPPATPPIGALTIGTRSPKLRDQGVDSIRLLSPGQALQHGQHDHRILDGVQGVPLRRNRDVVTRLAVPRVDAARQAHMTLQHLQRRLTGAVMFGEVTAGKQSHHRLPKLVGVTTVDGVCGAPAV